MCEKQRSSISQRSVSAVGNASCQVVVSVIAGLILHWMVSSDLVGRTPPKTPTEIICPLMA